MNTPVKSILLAVCTLFACSHLMAWDNHTLISQVMLESMPQVKQAKPVEVESLESFLVATEEQLEVFLAEQESWMQHNLRHYAPLPDVLAFTASGDPQDIRQRFSHAIRINPHSHLSLYLQLAPGRQAGPGKWLNAEQITTLRDNHHMDKLSILALQAGDKVAPIDVVISASDEPDHGMDIGLYTDSNTEYGQIYGFGEQPFGNPKLEYGTQAPFHMGFYHEPAIIFSVAGFLRQTYPEYRIQQFKHLAEFAFQNGHPYWGWRFMGLGLHYVGDFSNPYHVTPVPGNSTASTIWVGLLNMLGITQPMQDAVQIVSNRHTAIEEFQALIMTQAFKNQETGHVALQAIRDAQSVGEYQHSFVVDVFARGAYEQAAHLDEVILQTMPTKFVADVNVEYSQVDERSMLIQKIREHNGQAAVNSLNQTLARLLTLFGENGKSYVQGILQQVPAE
ncbi:MAG: hypothetical protein RPR40_03050 [Bermanella sp.]